MFINDENIFTIAEIRKHLLYYVKYNTNIDRCSRVIQSKRKRPEKCFSSELI